MHLPNAVELWLVIDVVIVDKDDDDAFFVDISIGIMMIEASTKIDTVAPTDIWIVLLEGIRIYVFVELFESIWEARSERYSLEESPGKYMLVLNEDRADRNQKKLWIISFHCRHFLLSLSLLIK